MRRSNVSSLSVIALVAVAMAFMFGYLRVEAQSPVGSGFTYQGRMFDASNAPVQGTCDLALRLYDHDSGGAQIGATVTITSVAMTDGYFDVTPDFGAPSFNGEARWLEIDAACPPGAGATTFPRQAINVVPYALYALNSSGITSTVYVTESFYYTPTYHLQGWDTITGTPGTYTPTAHTQDWGTITGQPAEYTPTTHVQDWGTITGQPAEYTPTAHTQDWGTITGTPSTYTPTLHDMITSHTYSGGSALDVFGLSAASTITRITPSSNPGATSNILASNSTGGLTLAGKLSYNESDWTGGNVIYVPVGASIQDYVNAAENGDTLILGSGQYIITSTITIARQLNIMGQGNAGFLTNPVSAGHGTLISSATPSIVAFQIDHDNVRIAHLSINLSGGSSSIGINVGNSPIGTGLVGIVITNIDVIVSGSGWSQGFTVYASDVIMRNLTFYISSTNDAASGFWLWNDSNTTRNAIVDAYNITGMVKGNATYAYGFVAENINDANTLTMNIENSSVRVLAGTLVDIAIASISTQTGSPVTNNSTINAFLCTLDGNDYDAQQNGANVLSLGGSVIVNNRVSGTVTYRATMASGTGVFGGTLMAASGSITDSSRLISFGNNDLTTTGIFTHTQDWGTITGAPGTYTPTAHTQNLSTITGLSATLIAFGSVSNVLTGSTNLVWNNSILSVTNPSGDAGINLVHKPDTNKSYINFLANEIDSDEGRIEFDPPYFRFYNSIWNSSTPMLELDDAGTIKLNGSTQVLLDNFISALTDGSTGGFRAGASSDVLWYRGVTDTWRTPDSVIVDGNIGIGTTLPQSKLHSSDGGSVPTISSGTVILGSSSGSVGSVSGASLIAGNAGSSYVYFGDTDDENAGWVLYNHANNYMSFRTGGSGEDVRIDSAGRVGIQTTTPNSFTLQVGGNVGPNVSNTYDLGSASTYWATIHYHTLTSHSLSVFSTTVTLQNGKEVSCLDALKEIKSDPTKKVKGVPHMDYATIPVAALNVAPTSFAPTAYGGYPVGKDGEDGADLDMMVSLMLCAEKELDAKILALDDRMSDFERRIADLEQGVR